MTETTGKLTDIARCYDALMFDPRNRQIYDESDFFNVGYWLPGTVDQTAACRNLVARLLEPMPNDLPRVLDVGCGCGGSSRTVKQLRPLASVIGINISARQLRHCRDSVPGCDFALMDAANLALPSGTIDCAVSVEAAFHFRTRAGFLREAFRVLRPGGRLALSDILFRDTCWLGDWMVPRENTLATPDAYAGLLHQAGFRDVVLVDATARCWTAFCRVRLDTISEQWSAGLIDRHAFAAQTSYFTNLMERSVVHYLLAFARKPVSLAPARLPA